MLHTEVGVTEIPQHHPEFSKFSDKRWWHGKIFDLVEAVRLTVSQLILAMQRIKSGGTLISRLHDVGDYETIKIISVFDKIAQIQLFKPVSGSKKNGTFYLIAKSLQPGHPEAVAAANEWKRVWRQLTFPVIDQDGHADTKKLGSKPKLSEEVLELLERFAERVIELGEPIWQTQKEALATGRWTKKQKRKTGPGRIGTDEASVAVTDNAAAAVHNSDEDLAEAEEPDDVDPAPVLRQSSKPVADGQADSVEMSAAMENLDIDS